MIGYPNEPDLAEPDGASLDLLPAVVREVRPMTLPNPVLDAVSPGDSGRPGGPLRPRDRGRA